MDDRELDELLATPMQPTPIGVSTAVTELVTDARVEASAATQLHRRRRRFTVGGVALGAVVLTAGGTLTAYQLAVPPFQTLEPGIQRIQEPISVDYVTVTGKDVQCEAFLEFRNLNQDQLDAARIYVATRDWSRFGQQSYDTAKKTAGSSAPDPVDRALGEVLDAKMTDMAAEAVPAAVRAVDTGGPEITGWSMACPTGQR